MQKIAGTNYTTDRFLRSGHLSGDASSSRVTTQKANAAASSNLLRSSSYIESQDNQAYASVERKGSPLKKYKRNLKASVLLSPLKRNIEDSPEPTNRKSSKKSEYQSPSGIISQTLNTLTLGSPFSAKGRSLFQDIASPILDSPKAITPKLSSSSMTTNSSRSPLFLSAISENLFSSKEFHSPSTDTDSICSESHLSSLSGSFSGSTDESSIRFPSFSVSLLDSKRKQAPNTTLAPISNQATPDKSLTVERDSNRSSISSSFSGSADESSIRFPSFSVSLLDSKRKQAPNTILVPIYNQATLHRSSKNAKKIADLEAQVQSLTNTLFETISKTEERLKQVEEQNKKTYKIQDPYQSCLYNTIFRDLNKNFLAAFSLGDVLQSQKQGTIGSFGALLGSVSAYIPVVGAAAGTLGGLLQTLDSMQQNAMLYNLAHVARDLDDMKALSHEVSDFTSTAELNENSIKNYAKRIDKCIDQCNNFVDAAVSAITDTSIGSAINDRLFVKSIANTRSNVAKKAEEIGLLISKILLAQIYSAKGLEYEKGEYNAEVLKDFVKDELVLSPNPLIGNAIQP